MSANPPITHQWHDDDQLQQSPSQSYALSGKIMLSSIIVLFIVVLVLVILHLYARWYILRFHLRRRNRRRRSTRIVFHVDNNRSLPPATACGLEASVLKSLPVFVYSPKSYESMPECAVCLSEFEEGETGRVLPKCKHCFHSECIDMWFGSHSTCPLCRSPVDAAEPEMTILVENQEPVHEPGSSNSPVQQDGDINIRETTSFSDRMKRVDVRIDVPNRNDLAAGNELTEFQLSSPSQGFRSPGSRLLSLKRIMNMSRKSPAVSPSSGVGSSSVSVSTESDLESARQESTRESSLPGSIR